MVWLSGPPGSGKTTLLGSYINTVGLRALWYQFDAGDSDAATFFYYLRQAIAELVPRKSRLPPLFTTEYQHDIAGFARRFFRIAFAGLPAEIIIVLDNYHELCADTPLHVALAHALEDIPVSANVLVASRIDPPPAFAQARLKKLVAVIDWDDLKLTYDESIALAMATGLHQTDLVHRLHQLTDGWLAGFSLLLEHDRQGGTVRNSPRTETLETVFDYFSQIIFDELAEQSRQVLLRTACMPYVTATLARLASGQPDAINVIESLYRRHLFVERRDEGEPIYQFHALFRAFLRHRARASFSLHDILKLFRRSALLLEQVGWFDDAYVLYVEGEAWEEALRFVVSHAPKLIAQGRWRTVLQWGQQIPPSQASGNPWIDYWMGRATAYNDSLGARSQLERAYDGFVARDHQVGQLLAAAAILETLYFHYREFRLMDSWIERVELLLHAKIESLPAEVELWVQSMFIAGATYRCPDNPTLPSSVARVESLLENPADTNLRVSVATVLLSYAYCVVDSTVEGIAIQIARPLLNKSELTAQRAALYLGHEGYAHYMYGRYTQALACFDEARHIAATNGLGVAVVTISLWAALCQRRAGMLDSAALTIKQIESLPHSHSACFGPLAFVKACVAHDKGDFDLAAAGIQEAWHYCLEGGSHIGLMLVGLVSSNIAISVGHYEFAQTLLREVNHQIKGPVSAHYRGAILLNEAWLAHRQGNETVRNDLICAALHYAAEPRARERFAWYPIALSELLPEALRHHIEPAMAKRLARLFNVVPARHDVEQWPYRMQIWTLGCFEVRVDDLPLVFGRKAPKVAIAPLKIVIALGGRNVPEERLMDALWPDEEADVAHERYTSALHRLRKLLGGNELLPQRAGALSLEKNLVWVDALALDALPSRPDTAARALELYRGGFLEADAGQPWIIATRERLRGKFSRAVEIEGERLEKLSLHEQAIATYRRGIAVDCLLESCYRGLMRCLDNRGQTAEAGSVFRSLQRALAAGLGTQPSEVTQELWQRILERDAKLGAR
jgi:LuxR family transcriptional regulator, maltose regulon positive regulatory protein